MAITVVTADVDETVCDGVLYCTVVFMNMAAIVKSALVNKGTNITKETFHLCFNDVP